MCKPDTLAFDIRSKTKKEEEEVVDALNFLISLNPESF